MEPVYTIKAECGWVKLYIHGILHLSIRADKLLGIQSWELDGKYCIEYTFDGGSLLTEYNKADKWKTILELVNNHIW